MNDETEVKPKRGRKPAKVDVIVVRRCSVDGVEEVGPGAKIAIPRELAKAWQDAGVVKIDL